MFKQCFKTPCIGESVSRGEKLAELFQSRSSAFHFPKFLSGITKPTKM